MPNGPLSIRVSVTNSIRTVLLSLLGLMPPTILAMSLPHDIVIQ